MLVGQHITLKGLKPIKGISFFKEYFINLRYLDRFSIQKRHQHFALIYGMFLLKTIHDVFLFIFPTELTNVERYLALADYEVMIG